MLWWSNLMNQSRNSSLSGNLLSWNHSEYTWQCGAQFCSIQVHKFSSILCSSCKLGQNKEHRLGHNHISVVHLWLQPIVPIDRLHHNCVPSFLGMEERWEEEKEETTNLNLEWKHSWSLISCCIPVSLWCLCRFSAPMGKRLMGLRSICAPREVMVSCTHVTAAQLGEHFLLLCHLLRSMSFSFSCEGFLCMSLFVERTLEFQKTSRLLSGTILNRFESRAGQLIFHVLLIWLILSTSWTLEVPFKLCT